MSLASAALKLHSLGLDPLTLVPGEKRPLSPAWQTQHGRSPEEVSADFAANPEAGLGVLTGRGLVVIDADYKAEKGICGQARIAELGGLPPTWTVETPSGGYHYYFSVPADRTIPNSVSKVAPGVDVRGDGGQVVAPPTRLADGREYRWLELLRPGSCDLAPLPEAWLARVTAPAPRVDAPTHPSMGGMERLTAPVTRATGLRRARSYVDAMGPAVAGQGGHAKTFDAACRIVQRVICEDDARAVLREFNEKCEPPWDEWELDHKLRDAMKLHTFAPLATEEELESELEATAATEAQLGAPAPGPVIFGSPDEDEEGVRLDTVSEADNAPYWAALRSYNRDNPGSPFPEELSDDVADMLKTAPRGKGTYLDRKYDLLSFRGFRPSLYAFDEHKTRPWRRLAGDRWSEGAGRDAIDHELLHAGLNKRSRDEFCKRVRHVEDALHVYDRAQRFVTVRGRRLLNVYEPCMLETGESGAVEAWADIRKVLLNLHDGNEKHLEWTLDWLATIIQDIRMGRPQLTGVATIFYGPSQGVGKGVLGEVLRALVGTRNMVTIRQQELDETFNGWAAGKLLVVANEVFSSENRTEAESNRLKPYISDPTIQVREMYAMPVERPNVSNWVAFSNNLRPVPVEQRDRRYTLFKVGPPIDPNLGGRVADDARAGGPGVRAFLRHLLEREPTVFRRYTPLATEAKAEVQYDTAHSGEKFVHDLLKGDGFHALADDYIRECGATDLYVRQEDETLVERRVLYEVYRRWALASGYRAIASSQLYRLVRSAGAKEERRRWGNRQAWFFLGLPGVAPHLLDAGGSSASFRTDGGAAREVSPQLAEAQRILEAV